MTMLTSRHALSRMLFPHDVTIIPRDGTSTISAHQDVIQRCRLPAIGAPLLHTFRLNAGLSFFGQLRFACCLMPCHPFRCSCSNPGYVRLQSFSCPNANTHLFVRPGFFICRANRCRPCHDFRRRRDPEGHSAEVQGKATKNTTVLNKQKNAHSAYSNAG